MRPVRLEMTAFGSYANHTVVPFEDIKTGLYLITGDTGAGKTTIFDAIVFALFGAASGTDRTNEMLHCDYVEKSVDTKVRLTFVQTGREHTVERTIHFPKKQGSQNEYNTAKYTASLFEEGVDPIEGATNVTKRCEELLGMTVDQFRKIVMLAQGEFREFLKADSEKKNLILGKLFDSSEYVYYQNLLAEARRSMSSIRDEQANRLERLMQETFLMPAETTEEEKLLYFSQHPNLLDNISSLIENETQEMESLNSDQKAITQKLTELTTLSTTANYFNGKFDELESAQKHLQELLVKEEAMRIGQRTIEIVDRALHIAKPAIDEEQRLENEIKQIHRDILKLEEDVKTYANKLKEATELDENDKPLKEEQVTLGAEISSIVEQLPHYEELTNKISQRDKLQSEINEANQKVQEECGNQQRSQRKMENLQQQLASVEDIEVEVERLINQHTEIQKQIELLNGENGIHVQVQAVLADEQKEKQEDKKLKKCAKVVLDKDEIYHKQYQHFLAGQAGLLAQELKETIVQNGTARCPVCNSVHDASHVELFACLDEATPSQESVDKAKKEWEKAEHSRQEQEKVLAELHVAISEKKNAICQSFAQLPSVDFDSWDTIAAPSYLENLLQLFADEKEQLEAKLKSAQKQKKQKDAWKKQEESLKRTLDVLGDKIEELKKLEQRKHDEYLSADTAVQEKKRHLAFESEEQALERKNLLTSRANDITSVLEQHQQLREAAKQTYDTALGSLEEKRKALAKQNEAQKNACDKLLLALEKAEFSSVDAVYSSLAVLEEQNGEEWLKEKRKEQIDYQHDCKNTKKEIIKLTGELKGRQRMNVDEVNIQVAQCQEKRMVVQEKIKKKHSLIENHKNTLEKADAILKQLKSSQNAWQRLDRLGRLAAGEAGEGGKLSFDRYVMGAIFREVLAMANYRMDIMSGGKYQLMHQVNADRKSAKAGLEIEVLDLTTGQQRAASTLSGGEAFFTSLALALGLSDAVQNHAGGRKLDALFIDEGFGSLSEGVLDKALEVLNQLTEGNRLVGIISHVDKLDESITQKIRVRHGDKGSTLLVENT